MMLRMMTTPAVSVWGRDTGGCVKLSHSSVLLSFGFPCVWCLCWGGAAKGRRDFIFSKSCAKLRGHPVGTKSIPYLMLPTQDLCVCCANNQQSMGTAADMVCIVWFLQLNAFTVERCESKKTCDFCLLLVCCLLLAVCCDSSERSPSLVIVCVL